MAKGKPGRPSAAHAMGAADKIAGTIGIPEDPEKILGAEETDGEELNTEAEAFTEANPTSSPETSTEGIDGSGISLGEPIPIGKGLGDDEEEGPIALAPRPKPLGVKQQAFFENIAFMRMLDNEIQISSKYEREGTIITKFQEYIEGAEFLRIVDELFPERVKK